jgi:hypothetical protein
VVVRPIKEQGRSEPQLSIALMDRKIFKNTSDQHEAAVQPSCPVAGFVYCSFLRHSKAVIQLFNHHLRVSPHEQRLAAMSVNCS